jgi:hypothetical protein
MNEPPEASSAIEPPPTEPSALVARIKSLSERIVRWGDKSDFVKLLELLGKFGLVIAAATYLFEIPAQRQRERMPSRQNATKRGRLSTRRKVRAQMEDGWTRCKTSMRMGFL